MSVFKKATRAQARLRLGLVGPAGSGKTMTAVRVAHGLGGRVAVIDTERGSASLYAGERGLEFDVLELDSYEAERFIEAISAAEAAGYSVLIIDSLSHAWAGKGGILEFVDKKAKQSGGGSFSGWRDATPRHNELVDAILGAKLHIICTLRSKVEHVIETVNGRTQVRKVGLQPVQRDGLEYEFTVVADVTQDHELIVTKTRAAWLKDQIIREAGEDLGKKLSAWLSEGSSQNTPAPLPEFGKPPEAPAGRGASGAAVPDEAQSLFGRIADTIAAAQSPMRLSAIQERVKALTAEGKLTNDQRQDLEEALEERVLDVTKKGVAHAV